MSGHLLTDAALRCYPDWWRELYAEEVAQLTGDLLADGRSELRLATNLVGGALVARISARGMPLRRELWARRARLSIAVATLPWLVALPFVLVGTDVPTRKMTFAGQAGASLAASASTHVLTISYEIVRIGLILSLLAGLAGWFAIRRGIRGLSTTTRSARLLVVLPLVVFCLLGGLAVWRQAERPYSIKHYIPRGSSPPQLVHITGGNASLAHALLTAEWVVLFVGVAASVVALATVAKRFEVWLPAITSGRVVSSVLAALVSLMALCATAGAVASCFHGVTLGAVYFPSVPTAPLPKGVPTIGMTLGVAAPRWPLLAVSLGAAAAVSLAGWRSSRQAAHTLWRLTTSY